MTDLSTTMTTVAAALFAGTLLGPAGVLCVESLSALLPRRSPRLLATGDNPHPPPSMAILVPAHDEEGGIRRTVEALLREVGPRDRLIVIADNCSDRTAEVARDAGAEVIERKDPERRGKGFALSFGANKLAEDPPDVVVIMDADCRVERGSLRQLAELSARTGKPSQGVYLMHAPVLGGASAVSAFAFMVRNLVRPTGLKRLGMPCQLTGTGMAFPWALYRDAPPTESFLVEDLLLGHELALRGHAPVLCDDLQVGSEFPSGKAASLRQRRRWEHGELAVVLGTAPRLLIRALAKGDPRLLALALDAAVPPLAFVVLLQLIALAVSFTLALLGGSLVPLVLTLVGTGLLFLGLVSAWLKHGRSVLPLGALAKIPGYVLWKLPLYASFVWRGAHREWERTERS